MSDAYPEQIYTNCFELRQKLCEGTWWWKRLTFLKLQPKVGWVL